MPLAAREQGMADDKQGRDKQAHDEETHESAAGVRDRIRNQLRRR